MKRYFIVLAVIALAVLSITAFPQRNREAETLFHRGVHFEEVRGELKEAIAIFEEIVKKYPDNRPVAARALYHLGLCSEKLGLKQATNAFQTIVEKYPEQTETVALAREKLVLLIRAESSPEKGNQELKISLVWKGADMDDSGEISPDGRYLSCADWTTSDLAIREMATGKVRPLTSKEGSPPGSYEAPYNSIWSPDSREIAYSWYGNNPSFHDLRIISIDGSKPRILYKGDYFKDWVNPCDWSPDGQYILAAFARGTDYARPSLELGLVSVRDGSVRYLEAARGINLGLAKISPDGRYIVFDHTQKANPTKNDLAVIPIGGKEMTVVVDHPADDRLLGWAPDGKSVLFLSDRTGTWDAWLIPVVDGKSQGPPRLIRRELGMVKAMGMTRGGSLYYSTPGFLWDIFSVSIDPDSGRLLDGPQKLRLPYEGHNYQPRLSLEGDRLAYISLRGPGMRNRVLNIFSFESGEVREIPLKGDFPRGFGNRGWTPDGRSVFIRAQERSQGDGLFKVDVQTGEATLLLREVEFSPRNEQGQRESSNLQISRDGRSVYYLHQGPDKFCCVMTQRLDSKDKKEICRFPTHNSNDNNTLRLSPDGLRFALLLREGENIRSLKVSPVTGGTIREVHRFEQEGRWINDLDWSPDSRYIYYSKRSDPNGPLWELWRVPAAGGDAQNLKFTSNRILGLSVHPDGKRIIFQSRTANEQVGAIWVMENFLSRD